MGEEVKITDGDVTGAGLAGDDDRVVEWEDGLPSLADLTPLSQALIPPELASAFRISPEPAKTMSDVNRASANTIASLRGGGQLQQQLNLLASSEKFINNIAGGERSNGDEEMDRMLDGSESRKTRRIDPVEMVTEESDSVLRNENDNNNSAKTLNKRPRLVWTPQLHKRFVDVVAHLGIKNAVPKTIMQLMNVEGLTRENVASHLQKYRLYLKRMQGLSTEGPSSSDHLFASTPVPKSLQVQESEDNGHSSNNGHMPMPMPRPMPMMYPPQMVPMHMMGAMTGHGHHGVHGSMPSSGGFHHHPYNMAHQRDWSGNKFGSFRHVGHNDK